MNKQQVIEEMAKTNCEFCRSKTNCKLDTCDSAFEEAEHLYNSGYRKRDEWISIKDRLPEKEEIVLCCLGLVQNVYTYKGDNIWEDSYGYYQKDEPITHWISLPEPPRGIKQNYERTK